MVRGRGGVSKGLAKKQMADAIIDNKHSGNVRSHATLMRLGKEELKKVYLEMPTKESVGVGTSSP
eukprot:2544412-Heterocapsa_arctica.AAC.1